MKFEFRGLICQEPALLNANYEVTVAGTSQVVDVRDIHKVLWKIENVEPRKYADPEPAIYRVRIGDQWKVGEFFGVAKVWGIVGSAGYFTTSEIDEIGECLGRPSWKRIMQS